MKPPIDRPFEAITVKLGPEIISDFDRNRRAEGRTWAEGYTQQELDRAQEMFDLRFPPDLIAFFLEHRPVRAWDWTSDGEHIREAMTWPLRGLLFDIERNGLWWSEWGARPDGANERAEVVRNVVRQAPKLIPLMSHRYLPSEPEEAGNPVFSIHQSDVIHYGSNIADYFDRDLRIACKPIRGPFKHIPFWSELVARNQ